MQASSLDRVQARKLVSQVTRTADGKAVNAIRAGLLNPKSSGNGNLVYSGTRERAHRL
jgi:hypothetical protein